MSRPVGYRKDKVSYRKQYAYVILSLQRGLSLRETAKLTGVSINTIRKVKSMFI